MSFTVRLMTIDDLAAIEIIQSEAYAGYFLESADVIAQRFNLSPTTTWVAEHDGNVCAYLVGYWSTIGRVNPLNAPFSSIAEPNCLYVHDLALLRSVQGFGLGKRLIRAAAEYAAEHKVKALALLSVQNSKDFWQNVGFAEFFDLEEKQKDNLNTYLDGNNPAFYMVRYF